jgi:hypothetical protein
MEARGREIEGEMRKRARERGMRAGERENGGEKRKRETSPKKNYHDSEKKNWGRFWTIDSHPMADTILSLFVPYILSLR